MKSDELLDALGEINEAYILEAAESGETGKGEDQESGAGKNDRVRKKWVKWTVIAAGFLLVVGMAIWFMLQKNGKNQQDITNVENKMNGSMSGEPGKTVTIPAVEYDPKEDYSNADMVPLVVFHGGIYTFTYCYEGKEAEKIKGLLGEYVGTASAGIDEWSDPSAYEQELAGTVGGKIYTVKGYDPEFRLCNEIEISKEAGGGYTYFFLERLNGITLSKGKELFEDRLHLSENTDKILWVSHAAWNQGVKAEEDAAISPELWNRFLAEADQAGFVDMLTPCLEDHNNDIYSTEQAHLTLQMKDGTVTILRLFAGGYVGYDGLGWYFAKLPGETFDEVFALAKGEKYVSGKDSGAENDSHVEIPKQSEELRLRIDLAREKLLAEMGDFHGNRKPGDDFYYEKANMLTAGPSYFTYRPDRDTQDEIYSFPIYDRETGEMVFMGDVVYLPGTDEPSVGGFSSECPEVLCKVNFLTDPENVLVYMVSGVVYFETPEGIYDSQGNEIDASGMTKTEKEREFMELSCGEKKNMILNRMEDMSD